VTSGLKLRLLRMIDAVAVRCADLVLLDTEEQLDLLPERRRAKAVVVPVGAASSWFVPSAPGDDGPLRVVFYGVFTPLQGTTVIGRALRDLGPRDDIAVTVIGTGQDRDAAREAAGELTTVTWRDWIGPSELRAIVAAHHVCLGIFGTTPKAYRVVPNKVYQGAAAGCAIVTSDTAPQRRALSDAARYVPPGDPATLAKTLAELAGDRPRVAVLREAARRHSSAQFTASAIVGGLRQRLAEEKRR
jgi:glycosyltransferase involved in cell wall biosynthesis